jgi:hypothetical protein
MGDVKYVLCLIEKCLIRNFSFGVFMRNSILEFVLIRYLWFKFRVSMLKFCIMYVYF